MIEHARKIETKERACCTAASEGGAPCCVHDGSVGQGLLQTTH